MKPLILGEAPGRGKDWVGGMFPLSGAVGRTLCRFADLEDEALRDQLGTSTYGHYYWKLREYFDCDNLLHHWPGACGKGSAFPLDLAYDYAWRRLDEWKGRVIVLLGKRVAQAFFHDHVKNVPYFQWFEWEEERTFLCVIPHPSGINRQYNDPKNVRLAGQALRQAIEKARE